MAILRDFEFYVEYTYNTHDENQINCIIKERNLDYNKASKVYYEENLREKFNRISNETRCVLNLYSRILYPKYRTKDCNKVLIELNNKEECPTILSCDGIYTVKMKYDINKFLGLKDHEKKEETLEILKQGLDMIIKEKNWDEDVFDSNYNKVIQLDYINNWYWKKNIKSPKKEYIAELFCEHNLNSFDASIIIKNNKKEELKKVKIFSEIPHELCYKLNLGELKWVSENEIVLLNIFRNKKWSVRLDSDKVRIISSYKKLD